MSTRLRVNVAAGESESISRRQRELVADIVATGAKRIVLTGVPNSGKTTVSELLKQRGFTVMHGDDLTEPPLSLGWSPSSEHASFWFDREGPMVVEGVVGPRALRKWLKRMPEGKPVDAVIFLGKSLVENSSGQAGMGKQAAGHLNEIIPELKRRGVEVFAV